MFPISFNKKLTIGFLLALALLLTLITVAYQSIKKLESRNNWVNHTYDVIRLTHNTSEELKDAEIDQERFIITGSPAQLTAFRKSIKDEQDSIVQLKHLVADNPPQEVRMNELQLLATTRIAELSTLIQARREKSFDQGLIIKETSRITGVRKNLLKKVDEIISTEKVLLAKRKDQSTKDISSAVTVMLASSVLGVALLTALYFLIIRTFSQNNVISSKLQLSESKFSGAFYNSSTGMAIVSLQGKWLDVNSYFTELLGYDKPELLNTTFQEITSADDYERNVNLYREVIEKQITHYQSETRFIHKDGHQIWTLINVSLVSSVAGSEPFFVTQIMDITKTKALFAELEIKNNSLSLTTEELKGKVNQLEEFSKIVAHNMRGPAGTIHYIIERVMEEESEEEKQDYMNMLLESSKSLNETLEELLKVVEIKLNDHIVFDNCQLNEIAETTSNVLKGEIIRAKAKITTDFTVASIAFPKAYMESIFYNMVSNSLKYRQKHLPAEIKISSSKENGKTSLVFEDNGLGIDLKQYGSKIFNLNQVFHAGYDSKGVGLFITKNQIETHGGTIVVDSIPNKGTKFTVHL
jgi:PAS domain S-box-containing protein